MSRVSLGHLACGNFRIAIGAGWARGSSKRARQRWECNNVSDKRGLNWTRTFKKPQKRASKSTFRLWSYSYVLSSKFLHKPIVIYNPVRSVPLAKAMKTITGNDTKVQIIT